MTSVAHDKLLADNAEVRRECGRAMEYITSIRDDLERVRAAARRTREYAKWQRYFNYDPNAEEFFFNLERSELK